MPEVCASRAGERNLKQWAKRGVARGEETGEKERRGWALRERHDGKSEVAEKEGADRRRRI